MSGSFLALDWGAKKIGWATGDEMKITTSVHPVHYRKAPQAKWDLSDEDKSWLKEISEEWTPETIVLGLPLSLDGTENNESQGARSLSEQIKALLKVKVVLINEALSTWENKNQKDEDSQVAAILLKDYWDQLSRS